MKLQAFISNCKKITKSAINSIPIPWFMEPGASMPHSQVLPKNLYSEPKQSNSSHSNVVLHLRLGFPKGLLPAGVPVKILKALLPSPILATWPVHLSINHPDYIRWAVQTMKFLIVDKLIKYEIRIIWCKF